MRVAALALLAAMAIAACAAPPNTEAQAPRSTSAGARVPAHGLMTISVDGRGLLATRFAAEAALMFPEESRALTRALLRQEFAQLESERLAITVDASEAERALAATEASLRDEAQAAGGLEAWAVARYGQSWSSVRLALAKRLELNQLYQLCTRAWCLSDGRVAIRLLSARDQATAEDWARKLRAGASGDVLAAASLDPGPQGDGRLPWLPARLPAPLGAQFADAEVGAVVGPFQFEGESVWRVAELLECSPPQLLPPRAELMADLRAQPISPLEERAWFEAMLDRYNARDGIPAVETPPRAFVRTPPR